MQAGPEPDDSRTARTGQAERTARTKSQIADAVITVLASDGMGALTHRKVAKAAQTSLAATTYHYGTKRDMVADASRRLLDGYVAAFRRMADGGRGGGPVAFDRANLVARLLCSSTRSHRRTTLAWCEIMLDCARSADGRAIAREWYANLTSAWSELATTSGDDVQGREVANGIDMVVGLLLMTVPLELTPRQVRQVLDDGADPLIWSPPTVPASPDAAFPSSSAPTRKARETRARILAGTIDLLVEHGAAGVTYRTIAQRAGLTTAAPAYHFGTLDNLLKAAEGDLFLRSKERYRRMLGPGAHAFRTVGDLADLTATIFVREVTEQGSMLLAIYNIWLEAARKTDLRPKIWEGIADQSKAWQRRLQDVHRGTDLLSAWLMQALYVGKSIRTLSTGTPMSQLVSARAEFHHALETLPTARE